MREFVAGLVVLVAALVVGFIAFVVASTATGTAQWAKDPGYGVMAYGFQALVAFTVVPLSYLFVVWTASVRGVTIAAGVVALLLVGAALAILISGHTLFDPGAWTSMLAFLLPILVVDLIFWGIVALYAHVARPG